MIKPNYTILAVDTSCDETAAAVTIDNRIIANVVSTQVELHRPYGGVVPMLAKRLHAEYLDTVIGEALRKGRTSFTKIDALAVTVGPGLAPALEVGVKAIKALALRHHRPLIAVQHMEGHLLSSFAANSSGLGPFSAAPPQFPTLGLLVSGGHTQLVLMSDFGRYRLLGETLDDAAGEAFDKVAKMLNLGYPGGPIISELAKNGQPRYTLPVPMAQSTDLNFSFSGLKTACLYKLKTLLPQTDKQFYCDFAASFEAVVARSIGLKLRRAIILHSPKQIVLGGGVINNLVLRKTVRQIAHKFHLPVILPYSNKLLTDNAAMIGVCAYYQAKRGDFVKEIDRLDRQPNLCFLSEKIKS